MDNPNDVAQIIDNFLKKSNDKSVNKTFKRGIVESFTGQKANIYVDGSKTTTKNVLCLQSYSPIVSDKVLLLSIGDSGSNLLVLGSLKESPSDWKLLILTSGWTRYNAGWEDAGYMKKNGIVYLRGMIKGGTAVAGNIIATLPVGYRPAGESKMVVVSTNGGGGSWQINNLGQLKAELTPGLAWVSLASISFVAEA